MINNAMNLSPYRRRATDAVPSTASALGGMPGTGKFGGAHAAVAQAGTLVKTMQLGMTIGGGVLVAIGVALTFLVGAGAGISAAVTGAALVIVARRFLPEFLGDIGDATARVGALAAKAQLAQTGTPTTARVVAMQPTGTFVNMNPQVQTALEVQGPNGPYVVNTTAVISQMYIPQFQPGSTVNVRVSQQNPYDVAVVF